MFKNCTRQSIKTLSTVVMVLSLSQGLMAQNHENTWFRVNIGFPIAQKWKMEVDFHHRRQNGYGSENALDKNLMNTIRIWAHHPINSHFKFSISPFAYFTNYKIIQNPGDEMAEPKREIRLSTALEWQYPVNRKTALIDKMGLEYRIFDQNPDVTRWRNRLGARYAITPKLKLGMYDELFCNLAGVKSGHFFDHNRLGPLLEINALPHLKLDIGYLYIVRLPASSPATFHENNFLININYQISWHKPHQAS